MNRRAFLLTPAALPLGAQEPEKYFTFESKDAEVRVHKAVSGPGYDVAVRFLREVDADEVIVRVFYPAELHVGESKPVKGILSDYAVAPYVGLGAYGGGDRYLALPNPPSMVRLTLLKRVEKIEIKRPSAG